MSEWISVKDKDKLPDYGEAVLGYSFSHFEDEWIVCWRTRDSRIWECHDMAPCDIDYWMPLPEPPKDL